MDDDGGMEYWQTVGQLEEIENELHKGNTQESKATASTYGAIGQREDVRRADDCDWTRRANSGN